MSGDGKSGKSKPIEHRVDRDEDLSLCADDDYVSREIIRRASHAFAEEFAEIARASRERQKKRKAGD